MCKRTCGERERCERDERCQREAVFHGRLLGRCYGIRSRRGRGAAHASCSRRQRRAATQRRRSGRRDELRSEANGARTRERAADPFGRTQSNRTARYAASAIGSWSARPGMRSAPAARASRTCPAKREARALPAPRTSRVAGGRTPRREAFGPASRARHRRPAMQSAASSDGAREPEDERQVREIAVASREQDAHVRLRVDELVGECARRLRAEEHERQGECPGEAAPHRRKATWCDVAGTAVLVFRLVGGGSALGAVLGRCGGRDWERSSAVRPGVPAGPDCGAHLLAVRLLRHRRDIYGVAALPPASRFVRQCASTPTRCLRSLCFPGLRSRMTTSC